MELEKFEHVWQSRLAVLQWGHLGYMWPPAILVDRNPFGCGGLKSVTNLRTNFLHVHWIFLYKFCGSVGLYCTKATLHLQMCIWASISYG